MKERFPSDRRPAWRQRFVAIAREMGEAAPRREPALRRPLLATRILRGVRLGCLRV